MSLAGTRVFIVEDEALILSTLQDMLEDLECQVVASAVRVDEALVIASELSCDVAILDVNIAGQRIDPVADVLAARGLRFFFATGYGHTSLPDNHRDRVVLAKPYRKRDLKAALAAVVLA